MYTQGSFNSLRRLIPRRSASPAATPFVLADGRPVAFVPITPASKPVIAAAMARMSPESIRRRFHAARRELSERDLDRLTRLDGWNQYAIGACTAGPDGKLEGIGVARFVRLPEEPGTAEIAITVVDAYQGRGIGAALVSRLADAATARGIRHLKAVVLPDNTPIIGLLRRYAPHARWQRENGNLVAMIPLATEAAATRRTVRRRPRGTRP